jgi:hypothetical protein
MIGKILLWLLLVLAALITVIIIFPVGVRVRYHDDALRMWYTVGPIRLLRYPESEKARESRKNAKLNIRTVLNEPIKANRRYDNVIGDFWAELKTTLELFWFLRPRLRIKRLELKLHLDGDDPAALALQYGGAWAAIGGILPLLEEAFILKKRHLDVDCKYTGGSTKLEAKLDITIGLGRLLLCLVRYSMDVLERTETKH